MGISDFLSFIIVGQCGCILLNNNDECVQNINIEDYIRCSTYALHPVQISSVAHWKCLCGLLLGHVKPFTQKRVASLRKCKQYKILHELSREKLTLFHTNAKKQLHASQNIHKVDLSITSNHTVKQRQFKPSTVNNHINCIRSTVFDIQMLINSQRVPN